MPDNSSHLISSWGIAISSTSLLSIIIVNWNVRDLLRNCLLSLQENLGIANDSYEIIVLDNASDDGSVDMLRSEFTDVTVIENDVNLGFGRGFGLAYSQSSGYYIWALNPDTLVPKETVRILLEIMKDAPDLGMLGPRLVDEDGSFHRNSGGSFPTLLNVLWNYLFLGKLLPKRLAPSPLFLEQADQGTIEIDWVSGAAAMLRRDAIGPYVPDTPLFSYQDDMEVCAHLRNNGWKVKFTSECSVVHFHGRSLQQQTDVAILAAAHKGVLRRFFRAHHGRVANFFFDLILFSGHLIRWPLYAQLAKIHHKRRYTEMSAYSRQYVLTLIKAALKTD